MDPNTLDRLARIIGSGQSRRGVLKTLGGGALGAMAAVIGIDAAAAAARCREQGVVCAKNADCCSAVCGPRDRTGRRVCAECGSDSDCPGDQCRPAVCSGGACGSTLQPNGSACNDGDPLTCNDVCTNGTCAGVPTALQTDNANCGACGNVCPEGQACGIGGTPGACFPVCPGGVCPAFTDPAGHCYWLSNGFNGQIPDCWYPTETFGITYTQQQCLELNGCATGGCYKLSTTSC